MESNAAAADNLEDEKEKAKSDLVFVFCQIAYIRFLIFFLIELFWQFLEIRLARLLTTNIRSMPKVMIRRRRLVREGWSTPRPPPGWSLSTPSCPPCPGHQQSSLRTPPCPHPCCFHKEKLRNLWFNPSSQHQWIEVL